LVSFSLRPENVRQAADLPEIRQPKKEMKGSRRNNRSRFGASATLAICFVLLGCSTTSPPSPVVTHVILIWLKHPERGVDRARLMRAAHSLRRVPGVLRVEAGRAMPALPPGVDRSFDLGVAMTFRDRAALERYEQDPRYRKAMHHYLRPLVRHYEAYNLSGG
jgi:hypothetical protein